MANEPRITISGNLAGDPELRYVASGKPVCNFTVAVTPRTYNRQTSAWDDGETAWYRCSVWDGPAENAADTLRKGMGVIVSGRLTTRAWRTDDGKAGTSLELAVEDFGPSLRWQRGQIVKANRSQQAPQAPQAAPQGQYAAQGGYGYQQAPQAPQTAAQGPWQAQDTTPPF